MFQLAEQLAHDTFKVGDFDLCEVRLMNDARYPWVILVPKREGLTELYQLASDEQIQLTRESNFVAEQMQQGLSADKMNVAALGNIVAQLHIHHIARFHQDEAWPAPVWGKGQAMPYTEQESTAVLDALQNLFAQQLLTN